MNRWLVAAIVFTVAVAAADWWWFYAMPPCSVKQASMGEFTKVTFEMLSDMNKYLISLATLLLGGLAAIGMKIHALQRESDRREVRTALPIAGIFGIGSLYFAFVSHVRLAEAVLNKCSEPGSKMEYAQFFQFSLLVMGLIVTLYVIYRFLGYERSEG